MLNVEAGGTASANISRVSNDSQAAGSVNPVLLVKPPSPGLFSRIWQYQKERYPACLYGALIASFTFAGLTVSAALRGSLQMPSLAVFIPCFVIVQCLFFQLRLIDDLKDYDEDIKIRPYLPVARGLLSKNEVCLGVLYCALLQIPFACCLPAIAQLFLLCTWLYMAAMSMEFGAGTWLGRHPFVYLLSHMLIMPLVDLFITACDWSNHAIYPPPYLWMFLLLSYINGLNLELARKIRSLAEEEPLYQTYSSLLGRRFALYLWSFAIMGIAATLFLFDYSAGLGLLAGLLAICLGATGGLCALILERCSSIYLAKLLKVMSVFVTYFLYCGLVTSVLLRGAKGW